MCYCWMSFVDGVKRSYLIRTWMRKVHIRSFYVCSILGRKFDMFYHFRYRLYLLPLSCHDICLCTWRYNLTVSLSLLAAENVDVQLIYAWVSSPRWPRPPCHSARNLVIVAKRQRKERKGALSVVRGSFPGGKIELSVCSATFPRRSMMKSALLCDVFVVWWQMKATLCFRRSYYLIMINGSVRRLSLHCTAV